MSGEAVSEAHFALLFFLVETTYSYQASQVPRITIDRQQPYGDSYHQRVVIDFNSTIAFKYAHPSKPSDAGVLVQAFADIWADYQPFIIQDGVKDPLIAFPADRETQGGCKVGLVRTVEQAETLSKLMIILAGATTSAGYHLFNKPCTITTVTLQATYALEKRAIDVVNRYIVCNDTTRAMDRTTGEIVGRHALAGQRSYTFLTFCSGDPHKRPSMDHFVGELMGAQRWTPATIYARFWYIGWLLTKRSVKAELNLHLLVMDYGRRGTGKSVFYNLIRRLFDGSVGTFANLAPSTGNNQFIFHNLSMPMLEVVFSNEYRPPCIGSAYLERTLLQLSCGEPISVESKGINPKTISTTGVSTWFNTNHYFRMGDWNETTGEQAAGRRLVCFPYAIPVDNKESTLQNRLYDDEMETIASVALRTFLPTSTQPPLSMQMIVAKLINDGTLDVVWAFFLARARPNNHRFAREAEFMKEFDLFCRHFALPCIDVTWAVAKQTVGRRLGHTVFGAAIPGYEIVDTPLPGHWSNFIVALEQMIPAGNNGETNPFIVNLNSLVKKELATGKRLVTDTDTQITAWTGRHNVPLPVYE